MMWAPLRIEMELDGHQAHVRCSGEIDQSRADELTQHLGNAMASGANDVVLDMTEVTFLDSTGLQRVIIGATECESLGLRFSLRPSPRVQRMLEVAGVRDIVHGRL
jgi:anti-anti-sigma factor